MFRMFKRGATLAAACLIGTVVTSLTASAQQMDTATANTGWDPWLEVEGKLGTERSLGRANLFVPIMQTESELLYLDLRGVYSDDDTEEGNFGIGYRHMLDDFFWGVYGYYDVQSSSNDNTFHQVTAGAEVVSRHWELRINGYFPLDDREEIDTLGIATADAFIEGQNIGIYGEAFVLYEEPYAGGDVELGYTIYGADFSDNDFINNWDFRIIGGYFYFEGDDADEEIQGPKVRLEARWHDPMGLDGWQLVLGAEGRDDDVRGDEGFLTAKVRVPLGRVFGSDRQPPALGSLAHRMTLPVERDVDIITNTYVDLDEFETEAYNYWGDEILGVVWFSDIDGSDTGDFDNPTSLDDAANNGGDTFLDSDQLLIVGVERGNGDISNTVNPKYGQILAAADEQLVVYGSYEGFDFETNPFYPVPDGESPELSPMLVEQEFLIDITENNVTVTGLDLQYAYVGIFAEGASNFLYENLTLEDMDYGIVFYQTSGQHLIYDTSITDMEGAGIYFDDVGGYAEIDDVIISDIFPEFIGEVGDSAIYGTGIVFDSVDTYLQAWIEDVEISDFYYDGIGVYNIGYGEGGEGISGETLYVNVDDTYIHEGGEPIFFGEDDDDDDDDFIEIIPINPTGASGIHVANTSSQGQVYIDIYDTTIEDIIGNGIAITGTYDGGHVGIYSDGLTIEDIETTPFFYGPGPVFVLGPVLNPYYFYGNELSGNGILVLDTYDASVDLDINNFLIEDTDHAGVFTTYYDGAEFDYEFTYGTFENTGDYGIYYHGGYGDDDDDDDDDFIAVEADIELDVDYTHFEYIDVIGIGVGQIIIGDDDDDDSSPYPTYGELDIDIAYSSFEDIGEEPELFGPPLAGPQLIQGPWAYPYGINAFGSAIYSDFIGPVQSISVTDSTFEDIYGSALHLHEINGEGTIEFSYNDVEDTETHHGVVIHSSDSTANNFSIEINNNTFEDIATSFEGPDRDAIHVSYYGDYLDLEVDGNEINDVSGSGISLWFEGGGDEELALDLVVRNNDISDFGDSGITIGMESADALIYVEYNEVSDSEGGEDSYDYAFLFVDSEIEMFFWNNDSYDAGEHALEIDSIDSVTDIEIRYFYAEDYEDNGIDLWFDEGGSNFVTVGYSDLIGDGGTGIEVSDGGSAITFNVFETTIEDHSTGVDLTDLSGGNDTFDANDIENNNGNIFINNSVDVDD